MKIHVKESTIIRPAKDTPRQRLWVSNLDCLQARVHMGTVFFYKSDGCSDFFDTGVLKDALGDVLVPFYPAAGRLGRDSNGRIEINCNAEGVLFSEAVMDSSIDYVNDLEESPVLEKLVPAVDYSDDASSFPLFLIQVTIFKCGGVSVGILIHHTLGDGPALLHFIDSWSKMAQGRPLTTQPFIDRTILRARIPPSPAFRHMEYEPPPHLNSLTQTTEYHSTLKSDSTIATFRITLSQLMTLKAKASNDKTTRPYSTYQVLVAHIWRCACVARTDLTNDQTTRLHIIINGRSRLRPALPEGYFGNVIFHARPIALFGDLKTERFTYTVERIHGAVQKMSNEYMRSALDYLEKHPNLDDLVPREGNPIFKSVNYCIVDFTHWPLYDLDFGWGRPVYARYAGFNEGKGYVVQSPSNDGSLLLFMCLKTSQVEIFKKLFYDFVSVSAM